MRYVDIHAHLEHSRFDDLDDVIVRCEEEEVVVFTSGVNPETNRQALALSQRYDNVKVSFGIYPIDALKREGDFLQEVDEYKLDDELNWIYKHRDDCVAIGEIGLDYAQEDIKNDELAREKQKEVFRKILRFAKKINKPVVIHSRKAEEDAINILEEADMKKVVMHCFSGKKGLIKRARDNGWYFSIPPVIKRLQHFQYLVELVPLSQLLTETDAPYLSPIAGERNEPINVKSSIEEIARIKEMPVSKVREEIFNNTRRLFDL
ncbi:MAG: TatD family hydrolase [Candidatus Nanoarchaeia archaeon]